MMFSWGVVSLVRTIPADDGPMQFLGRPILSLNIMLLTAGILALIGVLAGFFPHEKQQTSTPWNRSGMSRHRLNEPLRSHPEPGKGPIRIYVRGFNIVFCSVWNAAAGYW